MAEQKTNKQTNQPNKPTKQKTKEREKLRVLRRQNYQAREALLHVGLLAGNNAFQAPAPGTVVI